MENTNRKTVLETISDIGEALFMTVVGISVSAVMLTLSYATCIRVLARLAN